MDGWVENRWMNGMERVGEWMEGWIIRRKKKTESGTTWSPKVNPELKLNHVCLGVLTS